MQKSHRVTARAVTAGLIAGVALAALSFSTVVHSMSIGHSRLLSPVGQPLRIQTPLQGVSAQDAQSLSVAVAPAKAWNEAGLVPPVDLSSLQVAVFDGVRPGSKIVTVSSAQPLSSGIADLLLVVRSSSGQVQHQVSVLAPADLQVAAAATVQVNQSLGAAGMGAVPAKTVTDAVPSGAGAGQAIQVRKGDTLFSLARRHAVPGVSLYQWMVAVQAANPSAFIQDNVNLLKAGATLVVPDPSALVALSDAQARRVFQQHAHAFADYRQRMASRTGASLQPTQAGRGTVSTSTSGPVEQSGGSGADKVVLSSGLSSNGASADDALALQKNTHDAQSRVATLEDNVKNLSEALQQQGIAASEVASEGIEALADVVDKAVDAVSEAAESGSGKVTAAGVSNTTAVSSGEASTATTAASSPAAGSVASSADTGTALPGASLPSAAATRPATTPGSGLSSPASSSASSPPEAASPDASSSFSSGSVSSVPDPSSKSLSFVSWFQDHLWAVLAGIFALVVMIVVWLLRRAGAEPAASGGITEDMVRERLQGINLDLDEPPQGGSNTPR